MKRVFLGLMACALLATISCTSADARNFHAQRRNKPAPDFKLTALDGGNVRLSEQKGKPIVLAFFAYG